MSAAASRSGLAMQVLLVLLLTLAAAPISAGAQGLPAMRRAELLRQPVQDGAGLGGIRLGMQEEEVRVRYGVPVSDEGSMLAQRLLRYTPQPDVTLGVHLGAAGVEAVELTWQGQVPPRGPVTWRGVRIGDVVTEVEARYGPSGSGPLWYAAQGIAFNVGRPSESVESIVIFRRGRSAP
jgi:hypothetical protein